MIPLLFYVAACVFFVMFMHFAVGTSKGFDLFLMVGVFVFGGVIGWFFQAYELGLIFAVITSLMLW
jgi:hypothetical protein